MHPITRETLNAKLVELERTREIAQRSYDRIRHQLYASWDAVVEIEGQIKAINQDLDRYSGPQDPPNVDLPF